MSDAVRPSIARRILRWCARAAEAAFVLVILVWLVGHLVSDRYVWSQHLSWIPAFVPLIAIALAAGLVGARRRRRAFAWLAALIISFVWFGVARHRFLLGPPPVVSTTDVMHIVNWNVDAAKGDLETKVAGVVELNPDLALFSNPGWTPHRAAERMDPPPTLASLGHFSVLTRHPIRRFTWLGAADDVFAAILELNLHGDAAAPPFVVLFLDLPSEPAYPRAEAVRRARTFIESYDGPAPDVIAGDLNIERGAWSLQQLAPGYHHAYDLAGTGWGATFPREFPLWHIDHFLVRTPDDVIAYDLSDLGAGRHLAQSMWIVIPPAPRDESTATPNP